MFVRMGDERSLRFDARLPMTSGVPDLSRNLLPPSAIVAEILDQLAGRPGTMDSFPGIGNLIEAIRKGEALAGDRAVEERSNQSAAGGVIQEVVHVFRERPSVGGDVDSLLLERLADFRRSVRGGVQGLVDAALELVGRQLVLDVGEDGGGDVCPGDRQGSSDRADVWPSWAGLAHRAALAPGVGTSSGELQTSGRGASTRQGTN